LGRASYGPAHVPGYGLAQKREERLQWAEIGPTIFGSISNHSFAGLSSAQLSGPAQPTYLILYHIYYIIILYEKKQKNPIF